jgi:hypothetical protein
MAQIREFSLDDIPRPESNEQDLLTAQSYANLFELPDGGVVLADLKGRVPINAFIEGKPDAMAFICGQQSIIQWIEMRIAYGRNPIPRQEHV